MNTDLYPQWRSIQFAYPRDASGYALPCLSAICLYCQTDESWPHPKYAACKPEDRVLVMSKVFWKCLLSVSKRPYDRPCSQQGN